MLAKGEDPWEQSRKPLPAGLEPPASLPPFDEWVRNVIEQFSPVAERVREAAVDAAKRDQSAARAKLELEQKPYEPPLPTFSERKHPENKFKDWETAPEDFVRIGSEAEQPASDLPRRSDVPKPSEMEVPTPEKIAEIEQRERLAKEDKARDLASMRDSQTEPLAEQATGVVFEQSRTGRFAAAAAVVCAYLWQWLQLSIVVAAFLAFGGIAMVFGEYTFAEILYFIGVGLFIGKAIHELNTHELRKEIAAILIAIGVVVLFVLVGWTEWKRCADKPRGNEPAKQLARPDGDSVSAVKATPVTTHRLLQKTPRQLLALFEGRTELEADKLMEPFKNEPMQVTGKISQVSLSSSGSILVSVEVTEKKHTDDVAGIFDVSGKPEKEKRLRQLSIGEDITFESKVHQHQERGLLLLFDCEYIQP